MGGAGCVNAGLAEPDLLAEGTHSSYAFLQVAAGPDVAEEGHAAMLCFIRTCLNRKMMPARGANQTGVLASSGGAEAVLPLTGVSATKRRTGCPK